MKVSECLDLLQERSLANGYHRLSLPSMKPHMNTALSMMIRLKKSSIRKVLLGCRTVALAFHLPLERQYRRLLLA